MSKINGNDLNREDIEVAISWFRKGLKNVTQHLSLFNESSLGYHEKLAEQNSFKKLVKIFEDMLRDIK
jgi:hypothetical protein